MSETNKVTVIIDCEGNRKTLEVSPDEPLLNTLSKNNLYIKSSCGGVASCGDCIIKTLSGADNLSPPEFEETALLGNVFHITKERLSCQTKVLVGGATIDITHHDQRRDQEQLRKRTTHNPTRPSHKVRKHNEVEKLKEKRFKQREEEDRTWERHWEKDSDKAPSHKQGGHRRPRPFRTDHLDEDGKKEDKEDKKD